MKIFINENILISGQDWVPKDNQEFNKNLKSLCDSLYCIIFYLEPKVFYTAIGITKLFDNIKELESLSDYALTNPIDIIRNLLMEIEATNWDNIRKQRSDYSYYYQANIGAITHYVNNTSIAEAAENKFEGDEIALLNLASSDFNNTNPLHVTRCEINPPNNIDVQAMTIIVSEDDTIKFIIKNQKQRIYNWNKKHGENGQGMIPNKGEDVSPLECSIQEATDLLPFAIGCRKTDELYVYDEPRGKFMVFKDENTGNNSYHSYHPINQNEVDKEVQKYLLKNK